MIKNALYLVLAICCITACSSDLDFDQADEIVLSPEVAADLIFFTLGTETFINASIPDTTVIVQDTTRLEFLDDSFVRENVRNIEFNFEVDNSFAQSFSNRSIFLNDANAPQYVLEFTIAASPDGTPVRTTIIEQINENELEAILNATKVANEVQLQTNGLFIEGSIRLQSKALYSLEIDDF